MHADVSFTFLHRIDEVEQNIKDRRWQSALALALTLPDICGGIAFPEIVKRYRDGRIMLDRQKKPTRDVGGQYIRWFDEYAGDYFKITPSDDKPYICGERCWQLRCEYLHQNKGFLNDETERRVRFHLGVNCGTSVCQLNQTEHNSDSLDIRIDIQQFCQRMCLAARGYYHASHKEKNFSLYNTPVLDFIQSSVPFQSESVIALLCENKNYSKALMQILTSISKYTYLFHSSKSAREQFGKQKPDLWIVTEEMANHPDQPWRADRHTPVIFLARNLENAEVINKNAGMLTVLAMPLSLSDLRKAVNKYIH